MPPKEGIRKAGPGSARSSAAGKADSTAKGAAESKASLSAPASASAVHKVASGPSIRSEATVRLSKACRAGSVEDVAAALEAGGDPNDVDPASGLPLLCCATDVHVVRALLGAGADPLLRGTKRFALEYFLGTGAAPAACACFEAIEVSVPRSIISTVLSYEGTGSHDLVRALCAALYKRRDYLSFKDIPREMQATRLPLLVDSLVLSPARSKEEADAYVGLAFRCRLPITCKSARICSDLHLQSGEDVDGRTLPFLAMCTAEDPLHSVLHALFERGFSASRVSKRGIPLLHLAVSIGNAKAVQSVLSAGAPPNVLDRDGWSGFHRAVQECIPSRIADFIDTITSLHAGGGDFNIHASVEQASVTPLQLALKRPHAELALALLSLGASPDECDASGLDAQDYALGGYSESYYSDDDDLPREERLRKRIERRSLADLARLPKAIRRKRLECVSAVIRQQVWSRRRAALLWWEIAYRAAHPE